MHLCKGICDIKIFYLICKAPGNAPQIESRGRWFKPRSGHILSLRFETISTTILTLPLIQEGQLSVAGERMDTKLLRPKKSLVCGNPTDPTFLGPTHIFGSSENFSSIFRVF